MTSSVVIDAGIMIGLLDGDDAHHEDSVDALKWLADRGHSLVTSSLTLAEALVKPSKLGSDAAAAAREAIVSYIGVAVLAIDESLALQIAEVRAHQPKLKIPDAVVVASARAVGASRVLTTDHQLAKLESCVTPAQLIAE